MKYYKSRLMKLGYRRSFKAPLEGIALVASIKKMFSFLPFKLQLSSRAPHHLFHSFIYPLATKLL